MHHLFLPKRGVKARQGLILRFAVIATLRRRLDRRINTCPGCVHPRKTECEPCLKAASVAEIWTWFTHLHFPGDHKRSLLGCEPGLILQIHTFIRKFSSSRSVLTSTASTFRVSLWPRMTERAPAITSAFQSSGMRTRGEYRGQTSLFSGAEERSL